MGESLRREKGFGYEKIRFVEKTLGKKEKGTVGILGKASLWYAAMNA